MAVRTYRLHSYAIPAPLDAAVVPGARVQVPFGRRGRIVDGICVRRSGGAWDHSLPPVASVAADLAPLPPALVELGVWISDYYVCPPGRALDSMVPAALQRAPVPHVALLHATGAAPGSPLTAKQQRLLEVLAAGDLPRRVALQQAGAGPAVLRKLLDAALVEVVQRAAAPDRVPAEPPPDAPPASPADSFLLTAAQQAALDEINAAGDPPQFRVLVLYGVPGSGKTEVYVRAIRQVLAHGRQAILLVPEIALATQVVERLARRFPRVAVLHSRLAARQRAQAHRAIAAGAARVVIGTRSAVFAPCPAPGLIVVDEEQDGSYKSLSTPFTHARDLAIKRAQLEQIPVVLGSATPALETWHNAQHLPHYRLLRLPQRVGAAVLPRTQVLRRPHSGGAQRAGLLAPELQEELRAALAAGRQAILLHNRRGYAVQLCCQRCGLALKCTACGAPLVLHRSDQSLRCHRCGTRESPPPHCRDSTCAGRLVPQRLAIQRLEEELRQEFPAARLLRLDRDTMRRREDYAAALRRFEQREAEILLGTQMVAKGLDFPNVALVGVVDADAALALPSFRSAEQVFQLIMQVVGRAGRSAGSSLAIVQCEDPHSVPVRCAVQMDYEAFARAELALRQRFFYPPFARLVRLVLADERPRRAAEEAAQLCVALRALAQRTNPRLHVSDATPCPIERLRDLRRHQVLLRGPRDGSVQRLLHAALVARQLRPAVRRFRIDVDPIDLL